MTRREPPTAESQRVFAPGIFADQVALVTGGGSGIGLATARELGRLGARLVLCGRTPEKLAAAQAELGAELGERAVMTGVCDIRHPEQIAALVSGAMERFGRIDVLVNNAGGQFLSPAAQLSPRGFEAVVRNNLSGTFNVTVAVANAAMIPARGGRIINVIANIYRGFPMMVHTGAARAGVENMTMTLAVEWARHGILVNAVAPGVILSSGTAQYPKEAIELATKNCPLKRAGTVEEVAASIVFLASPAAQFITGATLRLDGAQSLWGDTFPIPD
ncbi:MAG TPA: SDR family oxidoreductase [Kofleriaceae bacterium]|nr:SDR family oxidoreductase [Kofleriaceae bacterium]